MGKDINESLADVEKALNDERKAEIFTLTDDEGNPVRLEVIATQVYKNEEYYCFLPADMDEDDEDFGLIILKAIQGKMDLNAENPKMELEFEDVNDRKLLTELYEGFIEIIYSDEEEE